MAERATITPEAVDASMVFIANTFDLVLEFLRLCDTDAVRIRAIVERDVRTAKSAFYNDVNAVIHDWRHAAR